MNWLALITLSMIEVIAIAAFGFGAGLVLGFSKRTSSRHERFKTAVRISAFAAGAAGLMPCLLLFQCKSPGEFREVLLASGATLIFVFVSFGIPFQVGSVSPSRSAPLGDE